MLNKVVLHGFVTKDVELKQTQAGVSVCQFSIGVTRNYKVDGPYPTDFIDVVAWRNTAEFVCSRFKKGSPIIIEGSIETRSYEDKNGSKHKVCEVIADKVYFAGGKDEKKTNDYPAPSFEKSETNFEELPENEQDLPF